MSKSDLSSFQNQGFEIGAGLFKRLCWYVFNAVVFNSHALLPYSVKAELLRWFGAEVGKGLVIKPHVNIKYPWKLKVGNHSWIGEGVWIDNLDHVSIGSNVCLSQGALILSGNHDYTISSFDLIIKPIVIEDGAWVGAKAIITQGTVLGSHSVLVAGSVASADLLAYGIYRGNPAQKIKDRKIRR